MPAKSKRSNTIEKINVEIAELAIKKGTDAISRVTKTMESTVVALTKEIEKLEEQLAVKAEAVVTKTIEAKASHERQLEEHSTEIIEWETKLAVVIEAYTTKNIELDKSMAEAERLAKLELEIKLKQNSEELLQTLAAKHKMTTIESDKLAALKEQLAVSVRDKQAEVQAVSAQMTEVHLKEQQALEEKLTLKHEAFTAKLEAENNALLDKFESAKQENVRITKQLDDLRDAMVSIQQASATPAINQVLGGK